MGADPHAAPATIVTELADRLVDPEAVAAAPPAAWSPSSLAGGYPAVALLYAELARADDRYWEVAHRYLMRAAAAASTAPQGGLYAGPAAVAFVASCAANRSRSYAGLLADLDRRVADSVATRLRAERQRIAAGRLDTTFDAYDVPSGMAGIGRYLLGRGGDTRPALTEILSYLIALTEPTAGGSGNLPGWWVAHSPNPLDRSTSGDGGHANLGLAHGIPGPLALLALSWQAGVRVPGQAEAIAGIVDWLRQWCDTDDAGRYWPAVLQRSDLTGRRPTPLPPARAAWCYGIPGVARAVQLAGLALGQPEWTAVALSATRAMLTRVRRGGSGTPAEAGLCHGWAGLLHLTRLIGMDSGDQQVIEAAPELAARVVERYDPQAPLGLPEGSVGVALALRSYVAGGRPASGWDAALLVG